MNKLLKNHSLVPLFLSLVLVLNLLPSGVAKAENATTLVISTAAELRLFSKNCSLDAYSKNLNVQLANDISLSNQSFTPIPIFFGCFDGQNHSISGLNINSRGSEVGLFRSLELGGIVRNLNVSGSVKPSGTACSVGMLVGRNSGLVASCTVKGKVSGETDTGGIVGLVDQGGIISGCSSDAEILGKLHSGGIAGRSIGLLENCENRGQVNTSSEIYPNTPSLESLPELGASAAGAVSDVLTEAALGKSRANKNLDLATISDISDTGGIVGRTSGVVRNCSNKGTVGYNHIGYNIGGIAGVHDGIISFCTNSGEIFGRKDIGGIVGQFEPDIAIKFGVNSSADLAAQLSDLTGTLKTLSNALGSSIDGSLADAATINEAVSVIEDSLKGHKDSADGELPDVIDISYKSLQAINEASAKIIDLIKAFTENSNYEIAIINSQLARINKAIIDANLSPQTTIITQQFDIINASISTISKSVASLEAVTSAISTALADGTITPAEKDAILAALKIFNAETDKESIAAELKKIADAFAIINTQLKIISDKLTTATAEVTDALKIINESAARLEAYIHDFSTGLTAQGTIINNEVDKLEDLLHNYLTNAGERLEKTFDTVYGQLDIINGTLSSLLKNSTAAGNNIHEILNSSIDQMDVIGNSVASMLDKPTYSSVDVSETTSKEEKPGQVSNCSNTGAVTADANVGGIVGIMAIEVGNDPEEDFALSDRLWVDTTALFRAIVMTSTNEGAICAKNECVGGIVGRCDVGAIYKTNNIASVTATNGGKCGGIAGVSEAGIMQSNALCDLSGADNLGGIVGLGQNVMNCRAMVRISGSGECHGAIAGDLDGVFEGNVFVKEELAGIDGVSYADKAFPLPYAEFITLAELPAIFRDLHLDFKIDSKLVKRISFSYGEDVPESEIPALPKQGDSFGVWEDFETRGLIRSATVNAIYTSWIHTLSSDEAIPLMLAEGDFSGNAKISIQESDSAESFGSFRETLGSYEYQLIDDGHSLEKSYAVHLRCDSPKKPLVAIVAHGETKVITPTRDGSYLVFEAPPTAQFVILRSLVSRLVYGILIALAVIALLILIVVRRKTHKKGAHQK